MDKVVKSDAEWKEQLGPEAFKVLRGHGTERAGTHEDFPKGAGTYRCKGCGAPLFDQAHKFESGTGWPSFWQPVDGVQSETVDESVDNSWFMKRSQRRPGRQEPTPDLPCPCHITDRTGRHVRDCRPASGRH